MIPSILMSNGEYFDFTEPDTAKYGIFEVAYALSNICRYTGHTLDFYSVAQHSVLVSYLVPEMYALEGLLHDAHEAFVGDMSAPLKSLLPGYRDLEDTVQAAVRRRFGVPEADNPYVKQADLKALATEKRDLMKTGTSPVAWEILEGIDPYEGPITPQDPSEALISFIARHTELTGGSIAYEN